MSSAKEAAIGWDVNRLETERSSALTTGRSYPIGATLVPGGANFSVFPGVRPLSNCRFLIGRTTLVPRVIPIDPLTNLTYHYWHVFVPGVEAGQIYGFRAYGPFEPTLGLWSDASKLLLDPYGRAVVVPKQYSREAARLKGDNTATAMKRVVMDPYAYDWEGDVPLKSILGHAPSSTRCMYAVLPHIPVPVWRRGNGAHTQDYSGSQNIATLFSEKVRLIRYGQSCRRETRFRGAGEAAYASHPSAGEE